MVGAHARHRRIARRFGQRREFGMQRRQMRVDRAHHTAGIVAAGRHRIEQDLVQPLDGGAQVLLEQPVELEGLPRGHA